MSTDTAPTPAHPVPAGPFTELPERRWRRTLRRMLWAGAALLLAAALACAVLLIGLATPA